MTRSTKQDGRVFLSKSRIYIHNPMNLIFYLLSVLPYVLADLINQEQLLSSNSYDYQYTAQQGSVLTASTFNKKRKQWNVFTHVKFPSYKIRVKENDKGLCDPTVSQVVGYLDSGEKHFFFWFFESRSNPDTDPLLLWLNGGPGCSSLTGLFTELGPCTIAPGGNGTFFNKHSWNNNANVIFLDQPVQVGFSYSDNGKHPTNSDAAAQDVYAFLELFLTTFPKFQDNDFHVTGESYAGHYIPAIGKAIKDANQKHISDTSYVQINLVSLAIGNGLTDPLVQYEAYPIMAADTAYGPVLPPQTIKQMENKLPTCLRLIKSCYKNKSTFSCVPAALYCNNALINPFMSSGRNIYDVRMKCDSKSSIDCYQSIVDLDKFLNLPKVQQELGVEREYKSCQMGVNFKFLFAGDWMKPYVEDIQPLLESGVKVLIYAGDADYICNWIGNKGWVEALEWPGKDKFNAVPLKVWKSKSTGKPLGELKSYSGLSYLRVFEAGHMVPMDQPQHSLEFINWWIHQDKNQ